MVNDTAGDLPEVKRKPPVKQIKGLRRSLLARSFHGILKDNNVYSTKQGRTLPIPPSVIHDLQTSVENDEDDKFNNAITSIVHGMKPKSTESRSASPAKQVPSSSGQKSSSLEESANAINDIIVDVCGFHVLHKATDRGSVRVVLAAIDLGGDIEYLQQGSNMTPLLVAANSAKEIIFKALIDKGANTLATDKNGRTVLHHAVDGGSLDVVKCSVSNNVPLEARDNNGMTALHLACKEGLLDIVRFLVEAGANFDAICNKGFTPALYSVQYNRIEVFDCLVEKGCKINVAQSQNNIVHVAAAVLESVPYTLFKNFKSLQDTHN